MSKIVVIAGYAPSLVCFRGPLLTALVDAGNEVITCASEATADSDVVASIERLGVSYRPVYMQRQGINPFADAKTLLELVRLLRATKPDIVLAYTMKPIIYGSIAARAAGVAACFYMIEGLGYAFSGASLKQRALSAILRILYRIALRDSRRVFFLNPDDLSLFVDTGLLSDRRKAVMLNGAGVDLDAFRPASFSGKSIAFLLIARLIREKGIQEYVQAARILKGRYPDTEFEILGPLDANPGAFSAADIQSWQQAGAVRYLGVTEDVRPYLSAASVCVLPSYREGMPRSVLEAMGMARPIITTDAPGCRETVVDGENGFIVPVRDVSGLVAAMERFILEPRLIEMMGERSRILAEEKYDVRKVDAVMMTAMGLNTSTSHASEAQNDVSRPCHARV